MPKVENGKIKKTDDEQSVAEFLGHGKPEDIAKWVAKEFEKDWKPGQIQMLKLIVITVVMVARRVLKEMM